MIGKIKVIDMVIHNRSFRIFSEPTPVNLDKQKRIWHRFYGGEVDESSRQLARYVHRMTKTYMPMMNPTMIYRLDRFGRGGHHRPFNDEGFAGIRIMETHENYTQQHQGIREENGIKFGDVIKHVNFEYPSKLASVNSINLAALACAPPSPEGVMIDGAVQRSTTLQWSAVKDKDVARYKI